MGEDTQVGCHRHATRRNVDPKGAKENGRTYLHMMLHKQILIR